REPQTAVGACRPAWPRPRDPRRERGRARSVLHARAGEPARPPRGGCDPRPCEPARPRRTRPGGRLRGAARRARPGGPRRGGARARRAPFGAEEDAARLRLGRPGLPGRAHPAPLREPRRLHDRRHGHRCPARPRRARARVLDRPRRRDLPAPRPVVPRHEARPRRATGSRRALRGRLLHAGEEGDADRNRPAASCGAAARAGARVRSGRGHRAGRRLPAEVDEGRLDARPRRTRPAGDVVRDGGDLVPPRARTAGRTGEDAAAARNAPRGRALDDRPAAALGDVRPLGYRRPLDEPPLPDRPADGVHLRRPPGRRRHRRAGLRVLRGLGRRHRADARRLPVRARLPVVRAISEVREPQRDARQGGRPHVPPAARGTRVSRRPSYNLTLTTLGIAGLAYALQQTMVVPAMPALQRDLHTTTAWTTWVLSGFLLAASVCTPLLGKLGDQHGKERLLVVSLALFLAGCIGAAAAWNIWSLIAFRLLQGAAGAIFPLAFSIIRDEFPRERIAGAIGAVSAVFGIGAPVGLILSG